MLTGFDQNGFTLLPLVFAPHEIAALIAAISSIAEECGVRSRGGIYAVRNLLEVSPPIRELAWSPRIGAIVAAHLGPSAIPVRGTLFDKIVGANWLVPWHQDLTICVAGRADVPGYGPWTKKVGVHHVQPPVAVLEGMLSVRIHLDDCEESNGALRVIPGTHRLGRLTAAQIVEEQHSRASLACVARAGDVMLMRPLLIHASSAASQAAHRRVIHIDYASCQLDGGLRWLTVPG